MSFVEFFTRKPKPKPIPVADPLLTLLQVVIENQNKQTLAVFDAVSKIGEASAKQAQVLDSYLKLFQTPGEPTTWKLDEQEENKEQLIKDGFPVEGTEAEQADWILAHI